MNRQFVKKIRTRHHVPVGPALGEHHKDRVFADGLGERATATAPVVALPVIALNLPQEVFVNWKYDGWKHKALLLPSANLASLPIAQQLFLNCRVGITEPEVFECAFRGHSSEPPRMQCCVNSQSPGTTSVRSIDCLEPFVFIGRQSNLGNAHRPIFVTSFDR